LLCNRSIKSDQNLCNFGIEDQGLGLVGCYSPLNSPLYFKPFQVWVYAIFDLKRKHPFRKHSDISI
jgi:hypothetical protein